MGTHQRTFRTVQWQLHTQRLLGTLGGMVGAIALGIGSPVMAAESNPSIQVNADFSGTTVHSGVATAGTDHTCGELSRTYDLTLAEDHDALRVRVDNGPLVLLVRDPSGEEYCIKSSNGLAEMEGYWVQGKYSIQVGRRTGTAQNVPFNLTVSAQ